MQNTLSMPQTGGDLVIIVTRVRLLLLLIQGRRLRQVLRVARAPEALPSALMRLVVATIGTHAPDRILVSAVGAVSLADVLDPLLGALELASVQAGVPLLQIPDVDLLGSAARSSPALVDRRRPVLTMRARLARFLSRRFGL